MSSIASTGESPEKQSKKRHVVTVTVDYDFGKDRFVYINEPFEIDQDDLEVVNEIIAFQLQLFNFTGREANQIPDWFENKKQLAKSCARNKDRRITELKLAIPTHLELPECISRFDALEDLNLRGCYGMRTFPLWIAKLVNLKRLTLPIDCDIEGFPDEIWKLANLEEFVFVMFYDDDVALVKDFLDVSPNLGIPCSIRKWKNLKRLDLGNVTFLPEEIANLRHLEFLRLSNYKAEFLPSSIGGVSNLKTLVIHDAPKLRCLPDSIGQLHYLNHLELSFLPYFRRLPETLGDAKRLEILKVNFTPISEIPASISKIPKLEYLCISSPSITTFPEWMFGITTLKGLELYGWEEVPNQLTLKNISNLKNLEYLNLPTMNLLEELPVEICNLTNLRFLGLKGTGVTVEKLHPNLKSLKNLKYLIPSFAEFADRKQMMELAKQCPSVQCFGDLDLKNTPEDNALFHLLFSRRVRGRVCSIANCRNDESSLPLSLWPYVLSKNPKDFSQEYYSVYGRVPCECCRPFDKHTWLRPVLPTRSDVLFQLLVEFGPNFVPSRSISTKSSSK